MTAKVLVFPNYRVFPAIIAAMHTFFGFHFLRFWLQSNLNLLEEWKVEEWNNGRNGEMESWKVGRLVLRGL